MNSIDNALIKKNVEKNIQKAVVIEAINKKINDNTQKKLLIGLGILFIIIGATVAGCVFGIIIPPLAIQIISSLAFAYIFVLMGSQKNFNSLSAVLDK